MCEGNYGKAQTFLTPEYKQLSKGSENPSMNLSGVLKWIS